MLWGLSKGFVVLQYLDTILNTVGSYWSILFSARLLDEVLYRRDPGRLFALAGILLGGDALIYLMCELIQTATSRKGFVLDINQKMMFGDKMMHLEYEDLETEQVQAAFKRVERETFNDGKNLYVVARRLPWMVSNFISVIAALAIFTNLFVQLPAMRIWILVSFAASGIMIGASVFCGGRSERAFMLCQEKISENYVQWDGYMDYLGDYQRGKEIRIFGLGRLLIGKLMDAHHFNDRMLDERNAACMKYDCLNNVGMTVVTAFNYCVSAAAALLGWITAGGMIQYVQVMEEFSGAVNTMVSEFTVIWNNADYLERYFAFLDMPSRADRKGCIPVEKRTDGDYRIRFEHVSFRYPGSTDYALRDINMEFRVGEKLAVVGRNGSGKTTFIKLLCRLYDPDEGIIYMNDIDIKRYDYREYLSLFSVVFQDFRLFSFSLGENVAVAEDYDRQQVTDALKKSGMEEFLARHPGGIDTVLYRNFDNDGVEVSGGEAQKIALARVVCKGAAIVILDEPTAALDPVSEYEIYKHFNDIVADRMTVYISHRMSSCRFCGDIAVFDAGRLVQRGSHEELMSQTGGKYYELWTAQAQHYVVQGTPCG